MPKRNFFMKKALILLTALFLVACGASYQVTTETFADYSIIPDGFPAGTSFAIVPTNENNPLIAKQMSYKIEQLLVNQGYVVNNEDADYQLMFSHKITEKNITVNKTEHSPQKTENKKGFSRNDKGQVTYTESSKMSLEWNSVPEQKIRYIRELSIHVFDGKEEVWSGSAKNTGDKAGIRETADYLLFSLLNRFGYNTQKSVVSKVHEKDLVSLQ
jgi:hypothetical protein